MTFKNRDIQYYIDLITVLTHKEIKVRYKSSFLGYMWSIVHPLAFAFVFFLVFKGVMRIQTENYTLFLIAGLFPWQSFSNSVNISPSVFLGNVSLIKKTTFPRSLILLPVVLQDMIHFVLAIPVIVLFMVLHRELPSFSWTYGIPILLCLHFLMTYGVALLISSVNLFFRDLERLTAILTMFVFYVTPIIYPEAMMPEKYRKLLNFNPLASLMLSWRNLFLEGTLALAPLGITFAYGVAVFTIGYVAYKRLSWRFAEVL